MQARNSTSSVLIIVLIVLTFPIWIGIIGGIFGIMVGLFGAVFGIVGGIFGAVFGGLSSLFGSLFGWGFWSFGFLGCNFLTILFLVLVVALAIRPRKK